MMKRTRWLCRLIAFLLLAACTSGDRQQRLAQLEELERQNVADSLMTNDSLAQALADFFDHHGTSNERLRAHYILGRTYADLGEAPAAINAYLDAAACADTTAQDCDWAKLSRVYGQMSSIMYKQNLLNDYVKAIDNSISYAWRAGDSIQALTEKMHKVLVYYRMDESDVLLNMFDETFSEIINYIGIKLASKYSLISVKPLLMRNNLEKADTLLRLYEQESGYVDSLGIVEKGRELYYYYKGLNYMFRQQVDSAEFFFRKEIAQGQGFFEKNTGAHGLANLFYQEHRYDSAAKYALYSYDMMDSVYAHKVTDEVNKTAALYNYSRFQQKALAEQQRANQEKEDKIRIGFLLFLTLCILAAVLLIWQKKRKKVQKTFATIVYEYNEVRKELEQLQEQKNAYQELIDEKTEAIQRLEGEKLLLQSQKQAFAEKEQNIRQKNRELDELFLRNTQLSLEIEEGKYTIQQLQVKLDEYRQKLGLEMSKANSALIDSGIFELLQKNTSLTAREWKTINKIVNEKLPTFSQLLLSKQEILNLEERKLCILFRLHCYQKDVCTLMDMKQSTVSKRASIIMEKIFKENGGSRSLQQRLEEYC